MIRYPNIIGKSEAQQLEQIKSYLHQLADELNFRLEQNAGASAASATVMAGTSSKPTKTEEAISNFNEIKGLIIKSADIVDSYSEQISNTLKGEFVAVSDFGTYTEDTLTELGISSQDIQATITKVESIDGEIKNAVQSEVKQTAESITLSVENGETTAQIVLKVGDREIPATIDMKGLVTFSNLLESDGTTQINGDNIITGKITSADKESMILDLDAGTAELTGKYKTTAEIQERYDGKVYYTAELTGSGLVLRRDGEAVATFTPFQAGIWSEDTTNRFVVHPQSTNYGDGSMFFGNDHASIEHKIAESFAGTGFAETVYKDDYGGETKIGAGYVSGLNAPTNSGDAVNKQYVDTNFAPAGYGLNNGFVTVYNTAALDSYFTCGWVRYIGGSVDQLLGYNQAIIRIDSYTNSVGNELVYQTAHLFGGTKQSVGIVQRFCFKNNWQPWEWINPPMDGAEYRTTERCEGKPVYAKRITYTPSSSLGDASETKTWSIAHGISNFGKLVRISGVLANDYPFPVIGAAGQILQVYTVTSGAINIISYKYVTSSTEVFDLYYTKSTD